MSYLSTKADQRRVRRGEVANLHLRGVTQVEIAARLDISPSTVFKDLKAIRQEWLDSRVRDFDLAREIELRKLDALEREAWEAWSRSQRPVETNKVSGGGLDLAEKRRGEKSSRTRTGEAKYLEMIARCIDRRCQILSLCAAARKIRHSSCNLLRFARLC